MGPPNLYPKRGGRPGRPSPFTRSSIFDSSCSSSSSRWAAVIRPSATASSSRSFAAATQGQLQPGDAPALGLGDLGERIAVAKPLVELLLGQAEVVGCAFEMVARPSQAVTAEEAEAVRSEEVSRLDALADSRGLLFREPAGRDRGVELLQGSCLVGVLELRRRHAELLGDGRLEGLLLLLGVEDVLAWRRRRRRLRATTATATAPTTNVRLVANRLMFIGLLSSFTLPIEPGDPERLLNAS